MKKVFKIWGGKFVPTDDDDYVIELGVDFGS